MPETDIDERVQLASGAFFLAFATYTQTWGIPQTGQIRPGETDLSRQTRAMRLKEQHAKGNAAVFEYRDGSRFRTIALFSGDHRHAERNIRNALTKEGIDFSRVTRIHTDTSTSPIFS